jgi:NAD(P)-dependent dehydrogenase (short-subunit alcohol dehydrogenase family)
VSSLDLFSLHGRTALVTGGTRGIGRAIATGLAEAGAAVSVVSRRPEACERTVEELAAAGHRAIACPGHLGSPDDIEAVVAATADQMGGIDIVVNNAATALSEPVGQITGSAMGKALDVNLRGPVLLLQAALPHLRRSAHASVINVVSAGAWMFLPQIATYAATKAGLVAFTRSAAAALAPDGVRINALAPGVVVTDMMAGTEEALYQQLVASTVLQRAASPDEMVGTAVFLASDASSYLSGSVLHVYGGIVAN